MGLFRRKTVKNLTEDIYSGAKRREWTLSEKFSEWDGSSVSRRIVYMGKSSRGIPWQIDAVSVMDEYRANAANEMHKGSPLSDYYTRWHISTGLIDDGYMLIRSGNAKAAQQFNAYRKRQQFENPQVRLMISEFKKLLFLSYPEAKRAISYLEPILATFHRNFKFM